MIQCIVFVGCQIIEIRIMSVKKIRYNLHMYISYTRKLPVPNARKCYSLINKNFISICHITKHINAQNK